MIWPLMAAAIADEADVVAARQRARQAADALGFERQDQVRIATAVSEVARNALGYAGGGRVEFAVDAGAAPQTMLVTVIDRGPGIADLEHVLSGRYRSRSGMGLGLIGARRLMDRVDIDTAAGRGTTIRLVKARFRRSIALTSDDLRAIADRLVREAPRDAFAELREQNRELLEAGETLRRRQDELRAVNRELEETNRGVLALYAELEDRAAELKRASEMRSRFHSNVSHELRTPIQSVMAISQLMLDRTDGELTPEQERQLRYIRQSGAALSAMVDDLLDLAKAEAGRLEVVRRRFTVDDLFGGLRGLLRPLRSNDSVELVFAPADDMPSLCQDEAKLTQVLRNLVSNALKFTDGGEVRVSADHDEARDRIEFRVADTGVGIAPGDQERVFEEFTQVPNRLQARQKGTGLGLSLSRRLIEMIGGDIRIESELGEGATFVVMLPRDGRVRPRVLVIDDDESWRYLIGQIETVEVIEAADAGAGLACAREEGPDLILLDLALPDRDGYAVLDELGRHPATADIPVVVTTASPLAELDRDRLDRARAVLAKAELTPRALAELVAAR